MCDTVDIKFYAVEIQWYTHGISTATYFIYEISHCGYKFYVWKYSGTHEISTTTYFMYEISYFVYVWKYSGTMKFPQLHTLCMEFHIVGM